MRAKYIQQLLEAHLHFRSPQGTEEHDEVHMQLQAHKQGMNEMPAHAHKYLQHLADPDNYSKALSNARVETYNKSSVRNVSNTDASDGISSLNPMKRKRVSSIYKQGKITSPIILRHKETGHEYLLAGNTRLTHGIHVAKKPVKVSVLEY